MTCKVDLHKYWPPDRDEFSDRQGTPAYFDDHVDWLDPCRRIVDLGCGTGRIVRKLRDQGRDVEGITYQQAEVDFGRDMYGLDLTRGDLHQLPYDDQSFDGFILWDVIEHCIAPLIVMREAHRILRPGGRGLIFVPGAVWQSIDYHIMVPTIAQMTHVLRLAGFGNATNEMLTNLSWEGVEETEMPEIEITFQAAKRRDWPRFWRSYYEVSIQDNQGISGRVRQGGNEFATYRHTPIPTAVGYKNLHMAVYKVKRPTDL